MVLNLNYYSTQSNEISDTDWYESEKLNNNKNR